MGMRIPSSSTPTGTQASATQAAWHQRRQDYKSLMSSLQSGDLAGAQKAWTAFKSTQGAWGSDANAASGSNPTGTPASSGPGTGNGPWAQLGQALQAGNLQAAQQAADAIQASRASHHHAGGGSSDGGTGSGTPAPAPTPAPPGLGTVVNLTA